MVEMDHTTGTIGDIRDVLWIKQGTYEIEQFLTAVI